MENNRSNLKWKLEQDVNDYVKKILNNMGLQKLKDFNEESAMSEYMKSSLKGSAKTKNKANFGKPDLHIEKYQIPVIFENKLGSKFLNSGNVSNLSWSESAITNYAANGAVYYARQMIKSGKYNEVIAIGVAGDDEKSTRFLIYYVYGFGENSYKFIKSYDNLYFLENINTFNLFLKEITLNEEEKHHLIIETKKEIRAKAKKLNKIFHKLNITVGQRVLYVAGCLLAMQDFWDVERNEKVLYGLTPTDLIGSNDKNQHDSEKIYDKIETFLCYKKIPENKRKIMLNSFAEIKKDYQRDEKMDVNQFDVDIAKLLNTPSSITKQLFTFIYENIYMCIDGLGNNVDLIGELYSEFLKYAIGNGKEGIVLTPPYITKLMVDILDLDENSKVLDLATGSAGFLISSMNKLIEIVNEKYVLGSSKSKEKIDFIKKNNLLGVELNADMFALATSNMILRGDGSTRIEKGNAFDRPIDLYKNFAANRVLLNPPFSFKENGLPFIEFGLDMMEKGGIGAIIIQDSAGSGQGEKTAKSILTKHTLLASLKMPPDLFNPDANVQTSIYIFEAHKPHDVERVVKFIDFRNDGYKRTSRGIIAVDQPKKRYEDIIKIYKAGKKAKISSNTFNIDEIYIEDFITLNGNDWNFDQHVNYSTVPTIEDFKRVIGEYLSFEVNKILKKGL